MQDKSINLLYFSGTSNTFYLANLLGKLLVQRGVTCNAYDITAPLSDEAISADVIGIGYPVHAFNCPRLVYDFCRTLPQRRGEYFVFKSSGEPLAFNNASSTLLDRVLKRKGWRKLGELHVVMPYNIITRHNDSMVVQMLDMCQQRSAAFVSRLVKGIECGNVRGNFFQRFISCLLRIEWGGAKLIGRGFKADKNKCIKCGKCANECPKHNINITDKVVFGGDCNICMRCVMHCPANAIKAGILNSWKVNGAYNLEGLADKVGKTQHYITSQTCGIESIYKKYFLSTDQKKE